MRTSLRPEIQLIPFEDDNRRWIYVHDTSGYAQEPQIFPTEYEGALQLSSANASFASIVRQYAADARSDNPESDIRTAFENLETAGYLSGKTFERIKERIDREFRDAKVREAVCAGSSYPEEPAALRRFLDDIIDSDTQSKNPMSATAIVAPHIDLRVAQQSYGPPYRSLRNSDAETFIIFGTSHYGWNDLFIPTFKNFRTPLGVVQTDVDLLEDIYGSLPFALTRDDIAHRQEHSIEFQALFLQRLFEGRPFNIIPILVTSFQAFIDNRTEPRHTERFSAFCDAVRAAVAASGKTVAYIASADMAHVGRKFGDTFQAAEILETLRDEDLDVLKYAAKPDAVAFFNAIARVGDRRRICGLPPIYTLLETLNPSNGALLDYRQWDETDTASAVTFASIAYYDH